VHELFASLLIGKSVFDIERHWHNMFRLADHWGYGGAELRAVSALDTALWDAVGQALDRPIYDLLGGACRDRIPVYDTYGGPNYFTDPVPYVQELLERGITAMKVNGFPFQHEGNAYDLTRAELERIVSPIRKIVEAVGDRMRIAIDGHGFWSAHGAVRLAQALAEFPAMLWLEELLSPRNVDAYLALRERTQIPICLAERFVTRYQFREFIERGALDIVMPDLVWTGGISETKKIAILGETYQLPVCPHDCTGPVNMFACAHICMNIPNAMLMESNRQWYERSESQAPPSRLHGLGLTPGWYADIVTPNATVADGALLAPQGPGLGTQLRPEVFERPDLAVRVSDEPGPHYLLWDQ
jgi:L-alanine-DL-glutamate epimerase-like enolase superfamily enzyme